MRKLPTSRRVMLSACSTVLASCGFEPSPPSGERLAASHVPGECSAVCTASTCNGCDPTAEHCASDILIGPFGVRRWPDPAIGPHRVDAAIHGSATCGGVKWAFATTDHVCGVFSTWLADGNGDELPRTRYDSSEGTVQIYGNMWSGAVRACASVCGRSICSPIAP